MKLYPANISHIGQRSEQQDRLGWFGFNNPEFAAHGGILGYVCDGMGGMQNGGMAAAAGAEAFVAAYRAKSPQTGIAEALQDALYAANAAVCRLAGKTGLAIGDLGSTLAAIVVYDGRLYWISAGDSRIYLLRTGRGLSQLTTDHTYALRLNRRVAAGEITPEAANADPDRDSLISYLGMEKLEEFDCNVKPYALQDGDRLLVCSDGVYGSLEKHEIETCLALSANAAADALARAVLAKDYPQQDNLSALVLVYGQAPVRENRSTAAPPPRKRWFGLMLAVALLSGGFGLKIIWGKSGFADKLPVAVRTDANEILNVPRQATAEQTPKPPSAALSETPPSRGAHVGN